MTNEELRIVKEALDRPEVLTGWEWDFIDNISEKDKWVELSDRQCAALVVIGEKLDG